jgi:hypothetical protein
VCQQTQDYLQDLLTRGLIYRVLLNHENIKKYPAMRQLFYDTDDPITDKWIIWFDDDSIADRDVHWLPKLLSVIVKFYPSKARIFGAQYFFTLSASQIAWVKSRPWYRNRPFQDTHAHPTPNGNKVAFPAGGFWALDTSVMREAGIPDEQIGHNGGDYMVGEQVWQTGYTMKEWNRNKQFIHTSSVARRGLHEPHTGTAKWQPGGTS